MSSWSRQAPFSLLVRTVSYENKLNDSKLNDYKLKLQDSQVTLIDEIPIGYSKTDSGGAFNATAPKLLRTKSDYVATSSEPNSLPRRSFLLSRAHSEYQQRPGTPILPRSSSEFEERITRDRTMQMYEDHTSPFDNGDNMYRFFGGAIFTC